MIITHIFTNLYNYDDVNLEFFTAVNMNTVGFRVMTPCSFLGEVWRF